MSIHGGYVVYPQATTASAEPWHQWRSMGFHPVWFDRASMVIGRPVRPDAWQCKRGCGTLVWDPATHIENVCRTWEPVAG